MTENVRSTDKSALMSSAAVNQAKDTYYQAAKTWESETVKAAIVERNRAYFFSVVCLGMLAIAVAAIVMIHSLSTNTVEVLGFNEQTGSVTRLKFKDAVEKITASDAYRQSKVYEYIMARETQDPTDADRRRALVIQNSTVPVAREYVQAVDSEDAAAAHSIRTVNIENITFLDGATKKTAHVQYSVKVSDPGGQNAVLEQWAAVVKFEFDSENKDIDKPPTEQQLWLNPFGFRVVSFRSDKDAAAAVPVKEAVSK